MYGQPLVHLISVSGQPLVDLISVSGHFIPYILKICQTVVRTAMINQFHDFLIDFQWCWICQSKWPVIGLHELLHTCWYFRWYIDYIDTSSFYSNVVTLDLCRVSLKWYYVIFYNVMFLFEGFKKVFFMSRLSKFQIFYLKFESYNSFTTILSLWYLALSKFILIFYIRGQIVLK